MLSNTFGLFQILQIGHFVFNNNTLCYYLAILCTKYFECCTILHKTVL